MTKVGYLGLTAGARISVAVVLVATVTVAVAGCGGFIEPRTGILSLTVSGLPSGTSAALSLVGPDKLTRVITASQTLNDLPPGEYVITAGDVAADEIYRTSPAVQTVTLEASRTALSLAVNYVAVTGTLKLTETGLPSGVVPVYNITGPENFARSVSGPQSISRLVPGEYTVVVNAVFAQADRYTPQNSPLRASVLAGSSTTASAAYVLAPATLNLRIDGAYLTQSTQRYDGSIPLIAGRQAYLRIFHRANESNAAAPPIRVRLYRNGLLSSTTTFGPSGTGVPTEIDQGNAVGSWLLPLDGTLIQPGFGFVIDVDPDSLVRETNDADNSFPSSGTPLVPPVVTAGALNIRFVPVVTAANGLVGNVSESNKNALLDVTLRIYPLSIFSADVHAPFTTSADLANAATGTSAWSQILSELDALRVAEGSNRYYAGIVKSPGGLEFAGVGYVGGRTTVSYDVATDVSRVVAHELGHNWGRLHAPCGSVANADLRYPHAGASIGTFGLDPATGAIKSPGSTRDLMSYCFPVWISDYTYLGVMNYRGTQAAETPSGLSRQTCLIVWGRIEKKALILESAFLAETIPSLPKGSGPYHLEGFDQGGRLFAFDFKPDSVADVDENVKNFAFAIPFDDSKQAQLSMLRLSGNGRQAERRSVPKDPIAADDAAVIAAYRTNVAGSSVITWNSTQFPLAVVRDSGTGEIIAFARGGRVRVMRPPRNVSVTLSNGVRSVPASPAPE